MTLGAEFFADMYAGGEDPWGFADRTYEARKRAITLACLPEARYASAFEPGCSIGILTAELATRCDAVLATDLSEVALAAAGRRLAGLDHVRVEPARPPQQWPTQAHDLVVLSELAYYLGPEDCQELAEAAVRALVPGGTLLAVHWRHPVADYPLTGDQAQGVIGAVADRGGCGRVVEHVEADFRLEVWDLGPARSVAERTGLLP